MRIYPELQMFSVISPSGPTDFGKITRKLDALYDFILFEVGRRAQCFTKVGGWVGMERNQVTRTWAITATSIMAVVFCLFLTIKALISQMTPHALSSLEMMVTDEKVIPKEKWMYTSREWFLPDAWACILCFSFKELLAVMNLSNMFLCHFVMQRWCSPSVLSTLQHFS